MNYHIMVQDKFLDGYIDDIYSINQEKNNTFWFRGNKGDSSYIKTPRNKEFLGDDKSVWKSRLSLLKHEDNLFIHWYDMWIGDLVSDLPNKIFVMFWAGEFYQEPYWYHANWVLDKKTLKLIRKQLFPKIRLNRHIYENIKTNIYNLIKLPKVTEKEYTLKNKYVSRIDYIMVGELNSPDLKRIKELYPTFKAKHLPSFYELNFDISSVQQSKVIKEEEPIRILVGNSAFEGNNHLEAFEILSKIKNIEIYCPLSYGNDSYKNFIIKDGLKKFKDNFHPITEYMSIDKYIDLLNNMDIIYMFQNRSQAWGNIAACLTLGKPVFMKPNNPTKQYIDNIGVNVYDAYAIANYNLREICSTELNLRTDNYDKLKKTMSREKRLADLSNIMEKYAK